MSVLPGEVIGIFAHVQPTEQQQKDMDELEAAVIEGIGIKRTQMRQKIEEVITNLVTNIDKIDAISICVVSATRNAMLFKSDDEMSIEPAFCLTTAIDKRAAIFVASLHKAHVEKSISNNTQFNPLEAMLRHIAR